MTPPNTNSVECPGCGRIIATKNGRLARHADDTLLRECTMSQKTTPAIDRAAQLVKTARTVLNLAEQIRDDDPSLVWKYLSSLGRDRLQTLAAVALTAVPPGNSLETAYRWVMDLPAARLAS
jgi:hypothetical protein